MNPVLKSRDYHRAYQKWDKLLIDGKVEEITVTPGGNSGIYFSLVMKKKPKNNSYRILQSLEKFPAPLPSLNTIRKDFDDRNRI